jgi:hypothetical protein
VESFIFDFLTGNNGRLWWLNKMIVEYCEVSKEYFENYNEVQLGINNFDICDYIKYVTDLNFHCFVKLVLGLKEEFCIEFDD